MTVLGIDPGSRDLAYAVVCEGPRGLRFGGGCRVRLEGDFNQRAAAVAELTDEWIRHVGPDAVACESVYLRGRSTTIHLVSHFIGLIHGRALVHDLPFLLLTPAEVKSALGWGRADKAQVARAVRALVAGMPEQLYGAGGGVVQVGSHLYDAVAVAVAGIVRLRRRRYEEVPPPRVAVYRSLTPAAAGGRR